MARKKKQSFFTLLTKAVKVALSYVYEKRCLIILKRDISSLDQAALEEQAPEMKVFEIVSAEELVSYFSPLLPQKIPLFRERLRDSSLHCYVAVTSEDTLMGYSWLAYSSYYEKEIRYSIPVEEDQVYSFDGLLHPRYRQGLLPQVLASRPLCEALKQGKKEALCLVSVSNKRAVLYHYMWGFKETMRCLYVTRLFGQAVHSKLVDYTEPYMTRAKMLRRKK